MDHGAQILRITFRSWLDDDTPQHEMLAVYGIYVQRLDAHYHGNRTYMLQHKNVEHSL